ncbi:MAG: hypothetical protein WDW36_006397 [Sanguina aurantia]
MSAVLGSPMANSLPGFAAPTGSITLATSDGGEVQVDKEELCINSKFFSDLLVNCDTTRIAVDETLENLQMVVNVMRSQQPEGTYDTSCSSCWEVLLISDKYNMEVVKERCEKWLVSRCLRGKTRCSNYKFQNITTGKEWLLLCQAYNLRDLGWYVSWDLGVQLAHGAWPRPVTDFIKDCTDPDFLKVMLEAVAETVPWDGAPPGGVPAQA